MKQHLVVFSPVMRSVGYHQVPWRSLALGSSPIVVELSDVRLIAAPREESEV